MRTIEDLAAAHPRLFKDNRQALFMSALPRGWYDLIDKLCRQIEMCLIEEELEDFQILQIKEKFAALRFYYHGSQRVRELIAAAEEQSTRTCEDCGRAATTVNYGGIYRTLCPACFATWRARREALDNGDLEP